MRITHDTGYTSLPFSAVCVIPDNLLNEKLRNIENPQHTAWEFNRLNHDIEEKNKMQEVWRTIDSEVRESIKGVVREGIGEIVDFEGAGDFLPSEDQGESYSDEGKRKELSIVAHTDNVELLSPRKKAGEDDFGLGHGEGSKESGYEEVDEIVQEQLSLASLNDGTPELNHGEETGDTIIKKPVPLSGIPYKNISVKPDEGVYDLIFKSSYDFDNCIIELYQMGESTKDKFPVKIQNILLSDNSYNVENGKIVNFNIKENETYLIRYQCDSSELFVSEVKMYAYR